MTPSQEAAGAAPAAAIPLWVALDLPLRAGDVAFSYLAPAPLPPGTPVLVPFRTRLLAGYVLPGPPQGAAPPPHPLRPVAAVLATQPLLPPDLLELALWMAERYVCSVGEALAAMLPSPFVDVRLRPVVQGSAALPRRARTGAVGWTLTGLRRAFGGLAGLRTFLEAGGRLEVVLPPPAAPVRAAGPQVTLHPSLWPEEAARARVVILVGREREAVTAAAVASALRRGRQALVLCASVAAAERMARRLAALGPLLLLHGDLPPEARAARWRAAPGTAVVVGTRHAVFAPLPRLGLIAVDGEGESGHVEERVPRYRTRDVAWIRAQQGETVLLLGDEVPSLAVAALAGRPGVHVMRFPQRAPRVVVVDLRRHARAFLTAPLLAHARGVLRAGGRVLLFVARRGYADGLTCGECGADCRCPQCAIPMALDARGRALRCRYCRRTVPAPATCPACGAAALAPRGAGSQRVARWAQRVFDAPVHRLDAESAPTLPLRLAVLDRFRRAGGVLVATVAALELPGLTADLVGVVLADAALRHADYRAVEEGFRTLWRVRALAREWFVVQTYQPDAPAVVALRRGDLGRILREELRARRAFGYPPFAELVTVEVRGTAARVDAVAGRLATLLVAADGDLDVLGPAPLPGRETTRVVMVRGRRGVPRAPLLAAARADLDGRVRLAVEVDGPPMVR
jgi:primosomal protein N' (replication factor Y)